MDNTELKQRIRKDIINMLYDMFKDYCFLLDHYDTEIELTYEKNLAYLQGVKATKSIDLSYTIEELQNAFSEDKDIDFDGFINYLKHGIEFVNDLVK